MPRTPEPEDRQLRRGDWRARAAKKARTNTPVAAEGPPDAPEWLCPEARAHFERLAPGLHEAGLLALTDGETLALLADALARFDKVREAADAAPMLHLTPSGERIHPLQRLRREALADCERLAAALGMSATARKSLKLSPPRNAPRIGILTRFSSDGFAT